MKVERLLSRIRSSDLPVSGMLGSEYLSLNSEAMGILTKLKENDSTLGESLRQVRTGSREIRD
jgi:hypothetical protein